MNGVVLSAAQQQALESQLRRTRDVHVFRRTLAVLEVSRGFPVAEVADQLRISRQSVYHWLAAYERDGRPSALEDAVRSGRPSVWNEKARHRLRALLGLPPDLFGYFDVSWTVPRLQEQLYHDLGETVSEDTIRRQLKRLGYAWKRSRYVLEPDPEKEKKTTDSLQTGPLAGAKRGAGRR
jgi:transposase